MEWRMTSLSCFPAQGLVKALNPWCIHLKIGWGFALSFLYGPLQRVDLLQILEQVSSTKSGLGARPPPLIDIYGLLYTII